MSGASMTHTESIWRNWPLRVEVTRGVTLSDDLTEVTDRQLIDIAVKHGNDITLRFSWRDARALREALTDALDATADLNGLEQPMAQWERDLLMGPLGHDEEPS